MRSALIIVFLIVLSCFAWGQKYLVPLSNKTVAKKDIVSNSKVIFNFSYEGINFSEVTTDKGVFNQLYIPNTYKAGAVGEPELASTNKLFTIPDGAHVKVKVNNYTTEYFKIDDYFADNKILPLQPSQSKKVDNKQKFVYNKKAYSRNSFNEQAIAFIKVLGKFRDQQVVKLVINPVQYNPAINTVKILNEIEVEVEVSMINKLKLIDESTSKNYSPYFNQNATKIEPLLATSNYANHPDLTTYPVKYLIVSPAIFIDGLQEFIEWKTQKGFQVVVGNLDEIGSTSAEIKTWVHSQYNNATANDPAPSFLILVGDIGQVPVSQTNGNNTNMETDLYYASVDGDMFPEMYYGRIPAQNTQQLATMIDKTLYYERYEFIDDSFLDDVTLIAGADGTYNYLVARPTVNYGTNFYFNADNGFNNVNAYLTSYLGCYTTDKFSVSLMNYTAHCSQTTWNSPFLSAATAGTVNNGEKYGIAIGNCCTSGDFSINECIGEAFVRNANGGAVAYIGSVPDTYWYEDFYWAVGAHSPVSGQYPDTSASSIGVYDTHFKSDYQTVDAMVFAGNMAVTEAHNEGYASDVSSLYYWEAYHCLGDPSIVPFFKKGIENPVVHDSVFRVGVNNFQVKAAPGSMIALSNNNGLIARATSGNDSIALVAIDTLTSFDTLTLVVTKPKFKPYINKIPLGSVEGTYLVLEGLSLIDSLGNNNGLIDYNEDVQFDLAIKNLGDQVVNNGWITISSNSEYLQSADNNIKIPFEDIAAGGDKTVQGAFNFKIKDSVPDLSGMWFNIDLSDSVSGETREIYQYIHNEIIHAPILERIEYQYIDDFQANGNSNLDYGETVNLRLAVTNRGSSALPIVANLTNVSQHGIIEIPLSYNNLGELNPGDSTYFSFEIKLPINADKKEYDTLLLTVAGGMYEINSELVINIGQDLFSEIGDDNVTITKYPFYNLYKNNRTQCLYLNSEFGEGVKSIHSMAFKINRFTSDSAFRDLNNFSIIAAYTNSSELLQAETLQNSQVVFDSSVYYLPDSTGWCKFDFETPFLTNDERNIIFEINWGTNDNSPIESESTTVLGTHMEFNSVAWGVSNNTNPAPWENVGMVRPNTQFEFDSVGIINYLVTGDLPMDGKTLVENCSIAINTNIATTDETGRAKHYFVEHTGTYSISFSANGYLDSTIVLNKTQTYEHVNMQLKRNPELVLSVVNLYSKPLIGVNININGFDFVTNGEGKVVCYNNSINKYSHVYINHQGYLAYVDSVLIKNTTDSVNVILTDKLSTVLVKVKTSNNQNIENAQIIIDDNIQLSNSEGEVIFENILRGSHVVQVYKNNFEYLFDTVFINTEFDTITYNLVGKGSVVYEILSDSVPLSNLVFYFNDSISRTDSRGIAFFNDLIEGEYVIRIENVGYDNYYDTINLQNGTITRTIDLSQLAGMQFYIGDGLNALPGIPLQFDDTTYYANSNGIINIANVANQTHSYSINNDNFYAFNDSVYFDMNDTIINIILIEKNNLVFNVFDFKGDYQTLNLIVNGDSLAPDINGQLILNHVDSGMYYFNINEAGYYAISDSVNLKMQDAFCSVRMVEIPDVKFLVTNGQSPVSGAKIIIKETEKITDAIGETEFVNIEYGTYNYQISCTGYQAQTGLVTIRNSDTVLHKNLVELADLEFVVLNNGVPLKGAIVVFDSLSFVSQTNGQVIFNNVHPGAYPVQVSYRGYDTYSDTILVSSVNITTYVDLMKSKYDLTLTITGAGAMLDSAKVSLGASTQFTDANGYVVFNDLPGNNYYNISISKESFIEYTDSVYISDRNVLSNFDLQQLVYSVKFIVADTNGFVEGANISFDQKVKQTDELGEVTFIDVVTGFGKNYLIRKVESHLSDTGYIDLSCDTTLNISLSLIPEIVNIVGKEVEINLYPNPTKGKLFINVNGGIGAIEFVVYNQSGVLIKKGNFTDETNLIDLNQLKTGIYLISFIIEGQKFTYSFILE